MARCDRPARAYRRSTARTRSESYGMSRAGFLQLSLFEDVQRHAKSGLRTCEPGLRDSQCAQAGRRRWRARGAAGCDGAYVPAHEHERPPVAAERPRRAHSLIVSQSKVVYATPVDHNLRARLFAGWAHGGGERGAVSVWDIG